jgi:hypothetical protein
MSAVSAAFRIARRLAWTRAFSRAALGKPRALALRVRNRYAFRFFGKYLRKG